MTLSGEKYLTAIVVIIVYIEEVDVLIVTLCKFAWSNCKEKASITYLYKKLHVAVATTESHYANDVTGVWDLVLHDYL